jgi:hypothetical protein
MALIIANTSVKRNKLPRIKSETESVAVRVVGDALLAGDL